jgi:hypothetical protein
MQFVKEKNTSFNSFYDIKSIKIVIFLKNQNAKVKLILWA